MIFGWTKIVASLIVAGLISALIFIVLGWKKDSEEKAALELKIENLETTIIKQGEEREKVQTAARGYQGELRDLRNYVSTRPPVSVRVCPTAVLPKPGPTIVTDPRPDAGTAAPGSIQETPGVPGIGREIGGGMSFAADTADQLSAQLRAVLTACN